MPIPNRIGTQREQLLCIYIFYSGLIHRAIPPCCQWTRNSSTSWYLRPQCADDEGCVQLLQMGAPVMCDYDPQQGRFLVATRPIHRGELVLSSSAFACSPLEDQREFVCAHCLKQASGFFTLKHKCEKCMQHWCSELCAENGHCEQRWAAVGDVGTDIS